MSCIIITSTSNKKRKMKDAASKNKQANEVGPGEPHQRLNSGLHMNRKTGAQELTYMCMHTFSKINQSIHMEIPLTNRAASKY